MTNDNFFLDAIRAKPTKQQTRLDYAEWLDDRDDPRGELIRLEEANRDRVAWDDTLWQTKPQRNQLRQQADTDWLRTMGYGYTCEPLLRGHPFPTNVRDAWRLIREAHERWSGEPMPDVGGHRDKVTEAERRLGLTLPPSIREYIAFAHDLRQREQLPEEYVQVYREWYSMVEMPGQPALSILELFEGDRRWGIPFNRLQHESLPVHRYIMQPNSDGTYQNLQNEDGTYRDMLFALIEDAPTEPLTEFIFWEAHTYCNHRIGYAGHMVVSIEDVEQTRSQLEEDFAFQSHFSDVTYFETRNFSAFIRNPYTLDAVADVEIRPCQPMTEADMPECVREWFRADAPCNGFFGDLRYGYNRRR